MNQTLNKAPVITWIGDKFNHQGTYNQAQKTGYRFYQMPIKLLSYIYQVLPGKNGNIIKVVTFLLGSGEGLGVSEALIEERTGLSHQAYCAARKWLLTNEPTKYYFKHDKKAHTLIVNYYLMWEDQREKEEKKIERLKDSYRSCANASESEAQDYWDKIGELEDFQTEYSFDE